MAWQPPATDAVPDTGWQPPATDAVDYTSAPQNYSLKGLASNVLPDIGRNIVGMGAQVYQGAYQIPKALATTPVQMAQGTPYSETDLGKYVNQTAEGAQQGLQSFAQDPAGAMYRNPVTTALAAGSLASKALPLAETGGTKLMSSALGPSQEAIEARMAAPEAIANAPSYADIAQKLPDTLNTLKDQISQHAETAYGHLSDSLNPSEGAIPKTQVQAMVTDLVRDLRTNGSLIGPQRKTAVENLNSVLQDIKDVGGNQDYISEANIKDVLKSIDKNVNWEDKGASETNGALTNFRGRLDQMLKSQNPDYAAAMQPVANKMGLLDALKHAFNITNRTGEGLQPTDTTISKIQSLPTERKSVTQGLANELNQATGTDLTQQSKNYGYARQFQGGSTQGSRKVLSYGGVGAGIGAKLGGAGGAVAGEALGNVAGLIADKYGGPIAGALVDRYAPLHQGIASLGASAPVRSLSPAALSALLNQYLSQQASQRPSQ